MSLDGSNKSNVQLQNTCKVQGEKIMQLRRPSPPSASSGPERECSPLLPLALRKPQTCRSLKLLSRRQSTRSVLVVPLPAAQQPSAPHRSLPLPSNPVISVLDLWPTLELVP